MNTTTRRTFSKLLACATTVVTLILPATSWAVSVGQIDTFQADSTTLNWANGSVSAPTPLNISTGGPAGLGDRFLQITSDGSSAGSKLTIFNRSQWAGSYGSSILAIAMDLKNLDVAEPIEPLSIRIGFKQSLGGGTGAQGYASTNAFALPADGAWHHAVFNINATDLAAVPGTTFSLATLLANVVEFRILNAASLSINGDDTISSLGIDNVQAVPEPQTLWLLASALPLLLAFRVRAARAKLRG